MSYEDTLDQFKELDDIFEKNLKNQDTADNLYI